MNAVTAQPPLDRQRRLHIAAFAALVAEALTDGHTAPARLLTDLYGTGLATLRQVATRQHIRLAGVSAHVDDTADPTAILRAWLHAARDRLASSPAKGPHR